MYSIYLSYYILYSPELLYFFKNIDLCKYFIVKVLVSVMCQLRLVRARAFDITGAVTLFSPIPIHSSSLDLTVSEARYFKLDSSEIFPDQQNLKEFTCFKGLWEH